MEKQINETASVFKRMLQDAEREGRSGILVPLSVDQAIIVLRALDAYKERMTPCTAGANQGETVSRYASPLGETVEGMLSPDYKERFKAEYAQLKIRHENLKAFNNKIEAARRTRYCPLDSDERVTVEMPKHDCPDDLLREQQNIMSEYLRVLEVRAVIEGVDLGGC